MITLRIEAKRFDAAIGLPVRACARTGRNLEVRGYGG
jgi:hypothetical protein